MPCPDPNLITKALAAGVIGDPDAGLAMLQPIVNDGPAETFAMLYALGHSVSTKARQTAGPGAMFGIAVDGPAGPATGTVDDLPPAIRFSAQFTSACANQDMEMAGALFWAVAGPADRDGTPALAEAIGAVYQMAVATAREVVAEQQRLREGR
ncbi:hypothetical protein ACFY0N_00770 [Streptomyces vinaceus]|uniref:hypothetical protein n=1 Tax=Streptomyces vinaceus TaxID=1960 RepID=UPI0036BD3072